MRQLRIALLVLLSTPIPAGAQGGADQAAPLRKTDLIRLLTDTTMSPAQIASRVQRNCLSFMPTARDRQNLVQLGADATILSRIDGCVRAARARTAAPRPAARPPAEPVEPAAPLGLVAVPLTTRIAVPAGGTASVGVALKRGTTAVLGTRLVLRGSGRLSGADADAEAVTDERGIALFRFAVGSRAGTVQLSAATVAGEGLSAPAEIELATFVPAPPPPPPPPPAPVAPRPSPERTGFASGMGQRGRVGETAAQPVVFEVRDSNGAALAGFPVTLTIVNGRLVDAPSTTDAQGQVRAQVVFGDRAGAPTVITGTAGVIVRQTMLYPAPGTPSQLVVLLDGNALVGQVVFQSGRVATLRIFCRDAVGNSVPLAALSGATGDERMLRVTGVTSDSLGGSVTVTAARAGSTTLVIRGTGLQAEFSALVRR